MRAIRLKKRQRGRDYRRAMREEKLLGRFVRLVDIMLTESTHRPLSVSLLVLSAGSELLEKSEASLSFLLEQLTPSSAVSPTGKVLRGVIQTSIRFDQGKTLFSPDHASVQTVINEQVFEGMASVLQQVSTRCHITS